MIYFLHKAKMSKQIPGIIIRIFLRLEIIFLALQSKGGATCRWHAAGISRRHKWHNPDVILATCRRNMPA